jgi:hypothetical protein
MKLLPSRSNPSKLTATYLFGGTHDANKFFEAMYSYYLVAQAFLLNDLTEIFKNAIGVLDVNSITDYIRIRHTLEEKFSDFENEMEELAEEAKDLEQLEEEEEEEEYDALGGGFKIDRALSQYYMRCKKEIIIQMNQIY